MKKYFQLFVVAILLFPANFALAQDNFSAKAGQSQDVLIGDSAQFDASESVIPSNVTATYYWTFGDGTQATGERITHQYKRAGSYAVKLTINAGDQTQETNTSVHVFRTENILTIDETVPEEKIKSLKESASEQDVLLTTIVPQNSSTTVADGIAQQFIDKRTSLERAQLIFVWTNGTRGTDIISNIGQLLSKDLPEAKRKMHMEEKGVVLLTDQAFSIVARPAQTAFNVLRPQYVLLARTETLPLLVATRTADDALTAIRTQGTPFWNLGPYSERAVSRLMPWNALSYAVNVLVNWGVPTSSIILVLMLPIIATLLAFSRQVIGMKAFGIFTPAAVTLSFLALGLKYGLIIFVVVLLAATASRYLLRGFRLLYLPRMALVLTATSFAVLGLFAISGIVLKQTGVLVFSVFPILILVSLAEQFVEVQIRLGFREATQLTVETLFLSIVSTLIVQWDALQSLVVGFPEVILITIPLNILLGRWTGLRLTEYFRFRKILFPGKS
ncbi:MAG: 7TM domain-containing protein [bacterium]|nr:7TM domain-containing protein [bacterium]